jgi:membrane fusion protein (multidrug efflux system)
MLGVWGWHAQRGGSLATLLSALTGSTHDKTVAPAPAPGNATTAAPTVVELAPVRVVTLQDDVTAVGSLVSNESVVLRPEVAGRIEAVHFRDGDAVRRGQVLIELDAAVQRAELQQAQANLRLAESNHRRSADLYERKFVSQSSLDDARSQLEVARASTALATARLARTRIVAPFDGMLGIRNVSPGDYVREGDELVNLEDIATLKVDFRLPELYLERVKAGQQVEITSDVVAGEKFTAVIDAVAPLVDAQGRSVVLRARMSNPEGRLRPGMFVRVRVIFAERAGVLMIPEESLVPMPGAQQFVYRIVNGRAQQTPVTTGLRRDAMIEVLSGLTAEDHVVTAGQLKLRDGVPVEVVAAPTSEK